MSDACESFPFGQLTEEAQALVLSKVSDKGALRQSSKLLRRLVDRTITVAKGQAVSSRIETLVGARLLLQRLEITQPALQRKAAFVDAAADALQGLQHASWPQLRDLLLAVSLTRDVAELLASSKMPKLDRLELASGGMFIFPYERATPGRPTIMETLAGAAWPELRSLALLEQRHLLTAGRPFAQAAWQLTRLEQDSFQGAQTNDLLRAAADKGWQLESLRLIRGYMTTAGAEWLAGAGWDLRELAVSGSSLSVAGAAALVGASWRLRSLDVSSNTLGDEGVARIALGDWPLLASLNISNVGMGQEGARALAAASWPALFELHVHSRDFDVMREALLESGWPADRVAAVLRAGSPLGS